MRINILPFATSFADINNDIDVNENNDDYDTIIGISLSSQ